MALTDITGIGDAVASNLSDLGIDTQDDLRSALERDDEDVLGEIPAMWRDEVAEQVGVNGEQVEELTVSGEGQAPLIKVGEIGKATFNISRTRSNGSRIESVEEEVDADEEDIDIDAFSDEIEAEATRRIEEVEAGTDDEGVGVDVEGIFDEPLVDEQEEREPMPTADEPEPAPGDDVPVTTAQTDLEVGPPPEEVPDNVGRQSEVLGEYGFEVELTAVGDNFGRDAPCSQEGDAVVWYFAPPSQVDTLQNIGSLSDGETIGSLGQTDFHWNMTSVLHNVISNHGEEWAEEDTVWGWLIGYHVCVDADDMEIISPDWTSDHPDHTLNRGITMAESVIYRVERIDRVPPELPGMWEIINPIEEMGVEPGDFPGTPEPFRTREVGHELPDYETEWSDEDFIIITQPNCPGCVIVKGDEEVQTALETGDLIEVTPDHPDFDRILFDLGGTVETPSWAIFNEGMGQFVGVDMTE